MLLWLIQASYRLPHALYACSFSKALPSHRPSPVFTLHLMSRNGGAISWRSPQQGGVTLSSSEAEFVAPSCQARVIGERRAE
jgi:hypothetical protein